MKFLEDEFKCETPRILTYYCQSIDPVGAISKNWKVEAVIKKVDFGKLSMDDDGLATIKLTLGVDHAELV